MTWEPGDRQDPPLYTPCNHLGPTLVHADTWTIVRCRGLPRHHGNHGNQAGTIHRIWSSEHILLTTPNGARFTVRHPHARQGPIPRGTVEHMLYQEGLLNALYASARRSGQVQAQGTAWDATEHRRLEKQAREKIMDNQPPEPQTDPDAQLEHLLQDLAHRRDMRPDRLVGILQRLGHEVELCDHVDPDHIKRIHHRTIWIRAGVLHLCHQHGKARGQQDHHDTRCQCDPDTCGTTTRSTVYGPIPPTQRPEEPLQEATP